MKPTFFIFDSYVLHPLKKKIEFRYIVKFNNEKTLSFSEYILLPDETLFQRTNPIILKILQSIHLILGISYFQLYFPPKIQINNFSLNQKQAKFWNQIYTDGLMQTYYFNAIDFRNFITFPYTNTIVKSSKVKLKPRLLIPLGGGKDSLVTYTILKNNHKNITFFNFGDFAIHKNLTKFTNENRIVIAREMDKKMIQSNKKVKITHRHVPIMAINMFMGLLVSILYSFDTIIFSNERSSDYGNIEYKGKTVNHQIDKSIQFEKLISTYINTYIISNIKIFSLLRPFHEIEIVRKFTSNTKFFKLFTSCNKNFKWVGNIQKKLWCCQCDKCAFVFVLLAAFIPKSEVISIFKENLLNKESLFQSYKNLLGAGDMKPFECVGTPEETKVAFYYAYKRGEYENDYIMKYFKSYILPKIKNIKKLESTVFAYGDDSNIPIAYRKMIQY